MALTTAYQSGIDTNILVKEGIPASIPVPIIANGYKDLAVILDVLVGGTLPVSFDTIYKIATELNTIKTLIGAGVTDGDAFVNTVTELLSVFSTFPEGVDILTAINARLLKTDVTESQTETVAGKAADATVIKLLFDELLLKQPQLTPGVNIKTWEGENILGAGNLTSVYNHATFLTLSAAKKNAPGTILDTATNLTAADYVYPANWLVKESDTGLAKVADGVLTYLEIPYGVIDDLYTKFVPGSVVEVDGLLKVVDDFESNNKYLWLPIANNGGSFLHGFNAISYGGTATARNIETTNYYKSQKRFAIVGATPAASAARAYTPLVFFRGSTNFYGGFDITLRIGTGTPNLGVDPPFTGAKSFYGLYTGGTGIPGASVPSALLNTIGIGNDDADTSLQIIHNDGSGVATKIPLGVNFPPHTIETDVFRIDLRSVAGSGEVYMRVLNETTRIAVETTINSNMPGLDTLLAVHIWKSNNAHTTAPVVDMFGLEATVNVLI